MHGMTSYFIRRILLVPVTFVCITFMVYAIQRLAPGGTLASKGRAVIKPLDEVAATGRHPRHTDDEVAVLLHQTCGASGPRDFAALDTPVQRRAIAELRTRSVSYRQLEKVTGVSRSALQRIHAARAVA